MVNLKLAVLAKIVANLILWFSKIERRRRKIPCDNCQQQKFVVAHSTCGFHKDDDVPSDDDGQV